MGAQEGRINEGRHGKGDGRKRERNIYREEGRRESDEGGPQWMEIEPGALSPPYAPYRF